MQITGQVLLPWNLVTYLGGGEKDDFKVLRSGLEELAEEGSEGGENGELRGLLGLGD
jgi:hypothetical protein